MTDREDFERLVLPLMRWLRAKRNPHTSVIVTSTCAEMVSGEMSVVESDERTVECVCAEIDPSDRPCLVCECSAPAQERTVTLSLPCECASLDPDERPCMACDILATVFEPDAPIDRAREVCAECNGTGAVGPHDPRVSYPRECPGCCKACNGTGKAGR